MLAALLMLLTLVPQDPCDEGYESAACAADHIAAATRNLSLPDIKTEFEAGAQVYRAVFDRGRYDRPAVSFERRPGRSPEVVLYGSEGRTLRREIGADVWGEVQARSRYVGRRLEPQEDYHRSCIVNSVAVVQIANPRRPRPNENRHFPGLLIERTPVEASQDSCQGGLTWDYAILLADLACEEIPECDAMGARDGFTRPVDHLGAVFKLRGDRVAAASLYGATGWPPSRRRYDQPLAAATLTEWLNPEYGATLDWDGSVIKAERGYDDPALDEISHFVAEQDAGTRRLRFAPAEFGADAADTGWSIGTVSYSLQADGAWRIYEAPYRQAWLRSGDHWRLWTMTVGAFESRAPRTD